MIFSVPAMFALAGVAILALFPDASLLSGPQMAPDRATLLFLLACAVIAQTPALFKRLVASRDASTFAMLCAFFVLFHLADRAGPREGWQITFPFAPEDPVAISYAARIVVLGALLSIPLWLRRGGPEKSVIGALLLVGAFGIGTLWFLGQSFRVGVGENDILAPRPTTTLLVQIVSYGALALCCRALSEHERVRAWVLRAIPLLLLGVVLRHQLSPIPAPKDDE